MSKDLPPIRILPMSDKAPGFERRSITDVQRRLFLRDLPRCNGRYRYPRSGLNAPPGTIVLFQFKARIIASATFLRDEKFEKPRGRFGGALYFDPASIQTFDPLDAAALRTIWPAFRALGHVKQSLNPAHHPTFKRRLKNVEAPPSLAKPPDAP